MGSDCRIGSSACPSACITPDLDWPAHYLSEGDDPAQAWQALYTDLAFRAPVAHWLARHARAGTPAWGYEFAHPIASPCVMRFGGHPAARVQALPGREALACWPGYALTRG